MFHFRAITTDYSSVQVKTFSSANLQMLFVRQSILMLLNFLLTLDAKFDEILQIRNVEKLNRIDFGVRF